jgi:YfiH family protein
MDAPAVSLATPVTEEARPGDPPLFANPVWSQRHPWLIQGITARGSEDAAFNLGLFTDEPAHQVLARWRRLRVGLDVAGAVHAHQVHRSTVRFHRSLPTGFHLAEPCDGHVTREPGRLLTVTVADCVPLTLIAPEIRAVAAVHAGWRGVVAGVAESALRVFEQRLNVGPGALEAHLGPAICGSCYEVGPEVHEGLGLPVPAAPTPVDLRAALAARLVAAGVRAAVITSSTWCTRCGDSPFFSHRGGDPQRQVAFAGIRG